MNIRKPPTVDCYQPAAFLIKEFMLLKETFIWSMKEIIVNMLK